jgi:EAL domain-containing protein (putative c-di-GMP-specific phosphodiesterase class I)
LNKRATFYEIPKNEIVLEITETAFSTHMDLAKDNLLKLMASGYQIHLDDFGTGYSSLFYLNRFPVNALKIDREFTNQYLQDKKSQEIIKSILDLAFKLDMAVVAEGVETEEQFNALKAVNCTFFQGYFFSKPIDGETFIELIAHQLNKDI